MRMRYTHVLWTFMNWIEWLNSPHWMPVRIDDDKHSSMSNVYWHCHHAISHLTIHSFLSMYRPENIRTTMASIVPTLPRCQCRRQRQNRRNCAVGIRDVVERFLWKLDTPPNTPALNVQWRRRVICIHRILMASMHMFDMRTMIRLETPDNLSLWACVHHLRRSILIRIYPGHSTHTKVITNQFPIYHCIPSFSELLVDIVSSCGKLHLVWLGHAVKTDIVEERHHRWSIVWWGNLSTPKILGNHNVWILTSTT